MKTLLLLLSLFVTTAHSATVRLYFTDPFTNTKDTNAFYITPIGTNVLSNGGVVGRGVTTRYVPASDGYRTNTLAVGHYSITNRSLGSGVVIRVPESGSLYDYTNLLISGYNIFVTVTNGSGGTTYTNNTGLPGVVLGSGIGTNLSTLATQSGLAAGNYAMNSGVWLNKPSGIATNYASLSAAKTASASGDVITATALNVGGTNLLKNGVDYSLIGVALSHSNRIPESAGIALGIFDDRGQGVVTNTIKLKSIDYRSQLTFDATAVVGTNPYANVTAIGPIVITNHASSLHLEVDTITHSIVGDLNNSAAIYVKDSFHTTIKARSIIDPLYLNPTVIIGYEADETTPIEYASSGAGIYWGKGNMLVDVKKIYSAGGYGVYGNGGSSNIEEYFHDGDIIYSSSAPAVYIVGSSSNYRSWFRVPLIGSGGGQALTLFGSQRSYFIDIEKLYSTASGAFVVSLAVSGSPEAWVTSQKTLSTNGGFVWMSSGQTGTLNITCQDYIDDGTLGGAIGFRNQTGTNLIHGGKVKMSYGKGIQHEGGRTYAAGLYIDTATTTNSANNPIFVSGAGLILKDCVLFAPAGAQAISATNAQTVTILGTVMCNQTNSSNITFVGGGTLITNTAMIRL
jgi:hypothetical protein